MTIATAQAATSAALLTCTVNRKALAAALALAAKVTERRNTIPILSTVRLTAEGDQLAVLATDLDLYFSTPVPAEDVTPGAICVDITALASTVKKMTGETVKLQYMGGRMLVADLGSGATARLATLPPTDYPQLAAPQGEPVAFAVPAGQFTADLARVGSAQSTEETRYYLNGIYFHALRVAVPPRSPEHEAAADELAALIEARRANEREEAKARAPFLALDKDGNPLGRAETQEAAEEAAGRNGSWQNDPGQPEPADAVAVRDARIDELTLACAGFDIERERPDALRMVATDGHRMAYATRPLPDGAGKLVEISRLAGVIVPRKAVKVAQAIIGKKPVGDVGIEFGQDRFAFRFGEHELRGKLIDGTFPDYTRVVPYLDGSKVLDIDSDALIQATEGATAHCNERTRAVAVSLSAESVIFSATSAEHGTAAVEAVASYGTATGAPVEELAIGFNSSYLAALAKAFGDGPLRGEFGECNAPAMFYRPGEADGDGFRMVLMPMRTDHAVMTRADMAALDETPWQKFERKAPMLVECAAEFSAREMSADPLLRKAQRTASCLAWQSLAREVCAARTFLLDTGTAPAVARDAIRRVILAALGDTATLARLDAIAARERGEAPASPDAGQLQSDIVASEQVAAVEPEPADDVTEEAAEDAPEPVVGIEPAPAEEATPQPPQEAQGEPEAIMVPAAAFAALMERVAALEAAIAGGGADAAPAEIQVLAERPDPAELDPVVIEPAERAQLESEIDRLRGQVAALTVEVGRLQRGRHRTAMRLAEARRRLAQERHLSTGAFEQVAALLKKRGPQPLPAVALPDPAPAVVLPAVPSRPRELVAA